MSDLPFNNEYGSHQIYWSWSMSSRVSSYTITSMGEGGKGMNTVLIYMWIL